MNDEPREGVYQIGETCPESGQWQAYDTQYEKANQITLVKGSQFPPIEGGGYYMLVDSTSRVDDGEPYEE